MIDKNIDKKTGIFLEEISKHDGKQLYEMTPQDARKAMDQMQATNQSKMPKTKVEKIMVKTQDMKISIFVIKPVASKNKILPVMVFFHGGGWVLGNYKNNEMALAKIAEGANIAVIAVEYPLAPENKYPIAVNQSYEVIKWIVKNGKKLGIDSHRLAIAGNSAGGNIAAVVSQMDADNNTNLIKYQILLSPVTNADFNTESMKKFGNGDYLLALKHTQWFWDNYISEDKRTEVYASPLQASLERLSKLPSTLIITAEYDIHRDEGESYAHKLMQAGVDVTSVRYLGTIHQGINTLADTPAEKSILKQIVSELKCNL